MDVFCNKKFTKRKETKGVLKELDNWFYVELPASLKKKMFISSEELVKVVEWKMTRGQWRARNKKLAESNTEKEVKKLSKGVFKMFTENEGEDEEFFRKCKEAIKQLSKLKGIGPATASAVLSAFL
eukprot:CAMPEP_0174267828 /NCGR_PEP_ID=MMETSP0439-20130205/35066_1 /TAXON_ID=0 /ORGANISM="Stereomyxa ramosa, Strain Chinc5" /LENGTH=125 /DNA_ID=CAMNT_0015355567 /DNA_START=147 /DNA_END=521 /DNA_ORIENTATION=-